MEYASFLTLVAASLCVGCYTEIPAPTFEDALVEPVVHIDSAPLVVGRCNGTHTVYELRTGSFISGFDANRLALPEEASDVESLARTTVRMSFSIFEVDQALDCDGAVVAAAYGFANALALVFTDPRSESRSCVSSAGAFREGLCIRSGSIGDWEDRIEQLRPSPQ